MPLDIQTAIVIVIVLLLFFALIVTAVYAFLPVPLESKMGSTSIPTTQSAPKGASLSSYANDPNLDHDPTPAPTTVSTVKPPPRIDPPISSKDIPEKDVPNPLFGQNLPVTFPNCMVHEGAVWSFCNGTKHKRYTMLQPTYKATIEKCNDYHKNTPCPPRI